MSCAHCVIYLRRRDGKIHRGCPHCWKILSTIPYFDEDLAARQVADTRRSHELLCPIPVRWGGAAETLVEAARMPRRTPVTPARSRIRYARR